MANWTYDPNDSLNEDDKLALEAIKRPQMSLQDVGDRYDGYSQAPAVKSPTTPMRKGVTQAELDSESDDSSDDVGPPKSAMAPAVGPPKSAMMPIPDAALQQLAKTRPDLVEAYKKQMKASSDGLADARKSQDMGNYANVAGKLLNDFGNSQKRDVVLGNRIQDLGKAPTILKADRPDYDPSVVNNITSQGVKRAEQDRDIARDDFNQEQTLTDLGDKRGDQQIVRDKALRENDPNSQDSVQARAYLSSILPDASKIPGFDGLSAAKAREIAPQLMDKYKLDETIKDRQQRSKEHSDDVRYKNAALGQHAKEVADSKTEYRVGQATQKMGSDLDVSKGRQGALGVAAGKVAKGQALQALANGDNNLDSRQTEELAIGIQSLLSGSNAGNGAQVKALVPSSIAGDANKVKEWLLNEPTGLQQQAFVKKMMETTQREIDVAKDQIKEYQVGKLGGHQWLKKHDPEAYNQILQSQGIDPDEIDDKGRLKKKAAAPGGQFPRTLTKEGHQATVSNADELKEAQAEGWK